jgi:hypothetical protein
MFRFNNHHQGAYYLCLAKVRIIEIIFSCDIPFVVNIFANEEEGMVSQNTTVIFEVAFYLG